MLCSPPPLLALLSVMFVSTVWGIILGSEITYYDFFIYGTSEEEEERKPIVKDSELRVEEIVSGLKSPTSMAFLGPDDILVLEKNNGQVKRITNGEISDEPLLDVEVSNQYHRGLLGIALTTDVNENGHNEDINEIVSTGSNTNNSYAFLYYTESSGDDGTDDCPEVNRCKEGNDPKGNRLYRYEFDDQDKLINPELLLDLPAIPGSEHVGGALLIGPDNNVYVTSGDGHSCRPDSESCAEENIQSTVLNSQTSNVQDGSPANGRGGILQVNQSGHVVGREGLDGGVLGNEDPLNKYIAYGIRNSFGMDFDPVSGKLWDTENGPSFGDEINLVEPGFNSGWLKVQGQWPIKNNTLLIDDGSSQPPESGIGSNLDENLVNFRGKGIYSDPEFVWRKSVGVTALKFLDLDKLGSHYENDMFVGDFYGRIYHFDLNEERAALVLEGSLNDKVAESSEADEVEDILFGEGFGQITDLEVGPDGHLYVVSHGEGKIFKISPNL